MIEVDGIEVDREKVEALRADLTTLRDAAIAQGKMSWAMSLSIVIAVFWQLLQEGTVSL